MYKNQNYTLSEAIESNEQSVWCGVNETNGGSINKDMLIRNVFVFKDGQITIYDLMWRDYPELQEHYLTLGDVAKVDNEKIVEMAEECERQIIDEQIESLKNAKEQFYELSSEIPEDILMDYVFEGNEDFYSNLYPYTKDLFDNMTVKEYDEWISDLEDKRDSGKISYDFQYSLITDETGNNSKEEAILYSDFELRVCSESVEAREINRSFFSGFYKYHKNEFVYEENNNPFSGLPLILTKCSEKTNLYY